MKAPSILYSWAQRHQTGTDEKGRGQDVAHDGSSLRFPLERWLLDPSTHHQAHLEGWAPSPEFSIQSRGGGQKLWISSKF